MRDSEAYHASVNLATRVGDAFMGWEFNELPGREDGGEPVSCSGISM